MVEEKKVSPHPHLLSKVKKKSRPKENELGDGRPEIEIN